MKVFFVGLLVCFLGVLLQRKHADSWGHMPGKLHPGATETAAKKPESHQRQTKRSEKHLAWIRTPAVYQWFRNDSFGAYYMLSPELSPGDVE